MNSVVLIGRLTKDPETRYTSGTQMAVCTFTVAIDRIVRQGEEKKTDYPRVTVFGKQAENCDRFLKKGRLVGVQGRLQTGSYQNKDGQMVYTTDVVADRVEFLERKESNNITNKEGEKNGSQAKTEPQNGTPEPHFEQYDFDIPF